MWAPEDDRGERDPRRWRLLAGIAALVLVVVVVPLLFRGGSARTGQAGNRTQGGTTGTEGTGAIDFVPYRDDRSGFTITYPKLWAVYGRVPGHGTLLDNSDPHVKLVLDAGTGGDAVRVSLCQLEKPVVNASGLGDVKTVTDGIFGQIVAQAPERQIKLLYGRPITLNGMVGYSYVYTYTDASGEQGTHVHYFLYQGRQLYQLIFQAVPSDHLKRFSSLFDQVADSFRTDPDTGSGAVGAGQGLTCPTPAP